MYGRMYHVLSVKGSYLSASGSSSHASRAAQRMGSFLLTYDDGCIYAAGSSPMSSPYFAFYVVALELHSQVQRSINEIRKWEDKP